MTQSPDNDPHGLERYRQYLEFLAGLHFRVLLRPKLDLSDIVQETFARAIEFRHTYHGKTDAERMGWLRGILGNVLRNEVRDLTRKRRDIRREQQSIQFDLDQSSSRLENWLAAEQSSPSKQATHADDVLALVAALAKLPEAQCEAVTLHYFEGLSLIEVGEILGRTPGAVAGLLKRGLETLRQNMRTEK